MDRHHGPAVPRPARSRSDHDPEPHLPPWSPGSGRQAIGWRRARGLALEDAACVEPLAVLSRFRVDFHACLMADELSELADAVLCADGPVRDLAGLSLAPEHRRGHGALYDAVNHGRVDIGRLRRSLAGLGLPRAADGRLVLAADVSKLAAARRGNQPGAFVLPRLRAGQGAGADDPGLAVLGHRGTGTGPDLVDGGAGRGAA